MAISLRLLLILVTVFCLWFGKLAIDARKQREAVEWIRKNQGNYLTEDKFSKTVVWVGIMHTKSVQDISPLAHLPDVEEIILQYNAITDVTPLARMSKLHHAFLAHNRITDPSPLFKLTQLRHLDVSENPISNEDVSRLKKALPNCRIEFGDGEVL